MTTVSAGDIFPQQGDRCEACGYPLAELGPQQTCPECGLAVTQSDPHARAGLAWQQKPSPLSWLRTALAVALSPRVTFRQMDVLGSNRNARLFLLVTLLLQALMWTGVVLVGRLPLPWLSCIGFTALLLAMTYAEAAGVWWVCWRRGWRMPWRRAERLVCFSAIGWLPATLLVAKLWLLDMSGTFSHWWMLADDVIPRVGRLLAWLGVLGAVSLPFETLVWMGVKRTRYANDQSR